MSRDLLRRGHAVVGIDNLNEYYDSSLKRDRLNQLATETRFQFERLDIANRLGIEDLFQRERFDRVIHLAAQAGVRYSLTNPHAYVESNIVGFLHILEGCRNTEVGHLTYASSSSVYGANTRMPFATTQAVDHPLSLYAATKKANELMAHTYSHLYNVPTTGLRFFTVYGPWGRPDMAMWIFSRKIMAGEPINVFNYGVMKRDFTFIDDITTGVIRVSENVATPNRNWQGAEPESATSTAPYRIYNIGNNQPIELAYLIQLLEEGLGKKAQKTMLEMQPGDVPETYADVDDLAHDIGFRPNTPIERGVAEFIHWFREFGMSYKAVRGT